MPLSLKSEQNWNVKETYLSEIDLAQIEFIFLNNLIFFFLLKMI